MKRVVPCLSHHSASRRVPLVSLYERWESDHQQVPASVEAVSAADHELWTQYGWEHHSGKVRECYGKGEEYVVFHTDRLSAFDQAVGTIPYRGVILCALSSYFLRSLPSSISHHYRGVWGDRYMLCRRGRPVLVEVIVRAAFAGSLLRAWRQQDQQSLAAYARVMDLPLLQDLSPYAPLPQPVVHLTTKADYGGKDMAICPYEAIEQGLLSQPEWEQMQRVAQAVYAHGHAQYQQVGLFLADTKLEFARSWSVTATENEGEGLFLVDEILTPDSSRLWRQQDLWASGSEQLPESFDKDIVRHHLHTAQDQEEDTVLPRLSEPVRLACAQRYLQVAEQVLSAAIEVSVPAESLEHGWQQLQSLWGAGPG